MLIGLAFSEKEYKKFLNEIIDKEEKEKGKNFTKDEREKKLKVFYEAQKISQKIRDEKRIK